MADADNITPAQKRVWSQWENDFVSLLSDFAPWVRYFMLFTMGVMLSALAWRLFDIYKDFVDPVKFEQRQAARRARAEKKDE